MTDSASVTACLAHVESTHGGLDALVNNAGAGHIGTVELEDPEELRRVMEVNFFGTVAVTRAAMPMLRSSRGRVVTISSVGGVVGQPFNEDYCAAKFAVEGFFEALAPVAGAVGVQVSLIEPGAVRSSFVENVGIDVHAMVAQAGPYASALGSVPRPHRVRLLLEHRPGSGRRGGRRAAGAAGRRGAVPCADLDWARDFAGLKLVDVDGSRVQSAMRGWIGTH